MAARQNFCSCVSPVSEHFDRHRIGEHFSTQAPTQASTTMVPTVNETDYVTDEPTIPPTIAPLSEPLTYQEFLDDLSAALQGQPSYLSSTFGDATATPQGKALDWIKNDNEYNLEHGTPMDVLLERYVLGVFFYSTDGPNWKYEWENDIAYLSKVFLKNTSFCTWVVRKKEKEEGQYNSSKTLKSLLSRFSTLFLKTGFRWTR